VIRIENEARVSRYPSSLHALVFEVAGILWIFIDGEGTQSLSQYAGRLTADKADLGPLLRAIHPGFARWSVVPDDRPSPKVHPRELRNGCFIESLAELRARRERGEVVMNARLLSYYYFSSAGRAGHTVLVFATDRGLEVVDPRAPRPVREFSPVLAGNALGLAQELADGGVAKARWVDLDQPSGGGLFSGGAIAAGGGSVDDVTAWE
jgi:hypothetical protein